MISSRTVHAVAISNALSHNACWFMTSTQADAQYDAIVKAPESAAITVSRFDLDVPALALPSEITLMVDEASVSIKYPVRSASSPSGSITKN